MTMTRITGTLAALALLLAACATDEEETAPEEYSVANQAESAASFIAPSEGDTVTSPFTVELAAEGVTLAPVGAPVVGEAHVHVMADIGCYDTGERIPGPSDEDEAEGRVQLADGVHTAFGDTETITVTVE